MPNKHLERKNIYVSKNKVKRAIEHSFCVETHLHPIWRYERLAATATSHLVRDRYNGVYNYDLCKQS